MSDDDIRAAYLKAIGNPMDERLMEQARLFIAAIFDALQPAGFIDGGIFSEEEWGCALPRGSLPEAILNFDYSAVRAPVLDFLFQHELFRIELREKYGRHPAPIHTDPSKEAERQDKRRNTMRANMRALFKGVFVEYGTDMRMGTTAIKQNMGRDAGSVLKALYTLEEDGCVARVGTLKAGSGREQIVWEWVGE